MSDWHDQADLIPIDGWQAAETKNLSDTGVTPFVHLTVRIQLPEDADEDAEHHVMDLAMSFDTASRLALDLLTITLNAT
jgi:hypothetical protein